MFFKIEKSNLVGWKKGLNMSIPVLKETLKYTIGESLFSDLLIIA